MVSKLWAGAGLALSLISTLVIILSFSTPYWMESDADAIHITQMEKVGLWEACFNGYSDYRDYFGRVYNGCWWMFSREYDRIRKYLMPGWFVTTQALMTLNVVLTLVSCFLLLLVVIGCFPIKARKLVVCCIGLSQYTIGILMIVLCVLFGTRAETDRTWLKQPQRRHLSWSFYCAVIGGLITFLAAMCTTVFFMKIRKEGHVPSTAYRARELRSFRNERQRQEDRYWR